MSALPLLFAPEHGDYFNDWKTFHRALRAWEVKEHFTIQMVINKPSEQRIVSADGRKVSGIEWKVSGYGQKISGGRWKVPGDEWKSTVSAATGEMAECGHTDLFSTSCSRSCSRSLSLPNTNSIQFEYPIRLYPIEWEWSITALHKAIDSVQNAFLPETILPVEPILQQPNFSTELNLSAEPIPSAEPILSTKPSSPFGPLAEQFFSTQIGYDEVTQVGPGLVEFWRCECG